MRADSLEMAGSIKSSDGIEAIIITPTTGEINLPRDLEVDGTAQLDGTVKVTGGSPVTGKALSSTDGQGTLSWVYQSVPSGETILFHEDTAVTGYTLQTGFDDGIVYITKGSAAGGETAGTNKSGGTWTSPGHTHGSLGYTGYAYLSSNQMPSHRHPPQEGYPCYVDRTTSYHLTPAHQGDNYGYWYYTNTSGSGTGHRHTISFSTDATPSTWRPYGRNFTRQTKV